jgi:putative phosphoesterase
VNQSSPIRIGVIADTHGLYDPAIEEHLSGVTEILHAGDIGGRDVILRLQKIAPVVAVSGNVDDYEKSGFPQRVIIRRGGIKIAICHVLYEKGQLMKDAEKWLGREQPAVCVFGHSHRPTIEQLGHIILFNPGSAGPRRFSLPRGVGLFTITEGKVIPRLIRLSDRVSTSEVGKLQKRSKQKGAV